MNAQPRIFYLICATPRSGSTLLTEALRGTGVAGRPDEFFLPSEQHIWQQRWGVTAPDDYLQAAIEEGMTPNGVFGAKIMWDHFDDFIALLRRARGISASDPHEVIATAFPNHRYIWITRRDKIRQAISHSRAMQTDFWHDWMARNAGQPRPQKEATYHFGLINELLQAVILQEAAWGQYFADASIVPLTVVYEDLESDYQGLAREIVRYLGLSVADDFDVTRPRTQKMADPQTEEWVRRYCRRRRAQRAIHMLEALPLGLRNPHVFRKTILTRARRVFGGPTGAD